MLKRQRTTGPVVRPRQDRIRPCGGIIACLLVLFTTFSLVVPLFPAPAPTQAAPRHPFPVFPVIRDNVRFWERVYDTYSSRQGILHDKDDLRVIYGVIDLVDWSLPGAARINRGLIKSARRRYKNILARLARGRAPVTDEEKRIATLLRRKKIPASRARNNIRLQIGQKDRFRQGVIRSGAWIHDIQAIFQAHQLPVELAYLPHVESSFNPRAHSKAGAVGLWQFTKSTGRAYLTINQVLDERYDPYLSTHAAARLLKDNYRELGSWPLALTAYNYGLPGMKRARASKGSYENIFRNHRTRLFKFASRNFYSEFIAAVRVARKLEKEPGLIMDRPEATLTVRMEGWADGPALRRYFNVSRTDFARLNPALRPPVLAGKKYIPPKYLLRLPALPGITKKINKMGRRFYHSRQIRDRVHVVRRGDTIGGIAHRYGIATRDLLAANNLRKNDIIRVGQRLILPRGGDHRGKKNRKDKTDKTGVIILRDRAKTRP